MFVHSKPPWMIVAIGRYSTMTPQDLSLRRTLCLVTAHLCAKAIITAKAWMLGAWFYILLSHVMVQRQEHSQLFKQARHAKCQPYFIDILRLLHNEIVHGVLRAGQLLLTKYQIQVHLQASGDMSVACCAFLDHSDGNWSCYFTVWSYFLIEWCNKYDQTWLFITYIVLEKCLMECISAQTTEH